MPPSSRQAPGPLFFSGGTALRPLARVLARRRLPSAHVVTPFDSGGSSAALRRALRMPAVGDLRNRILALADLSRPGVAEAHDLLRHRLGPGGGGEDPRRRLVRIVRAEEPLAAGLPQRLRDRVLPRLEWVLGAAGTTDLDLRGASLGNLYMAAEYAANGRRLARAAASLAGVVEARGRVLPVVEDDLHLGAVLDDGTRLDRQHLLTGKHHPPIRSPVREVRLLDRDGAEASAAIGDEVAGLIEAADLLVFPPGSFWSSVVANLLAEGVGRAVARAGCPVVYVPSTGEDPEQTGMSVADAVEALLEMLRRDAGEGTPAADLVDMVLVDPRGDYRVSLDPEEVRALGVPVVEADLGGGGNGPDLHPERLCEALLSLT